MDFPRTLDADIWHSYMERPLTEEEKSLFDCVRQEKRFNEKIIKLANNADNKGLYIPKLTNLHGNCLFECLEYNGLITNHDEFRKDLAFMMQIFKNYKEFFLDCKNTLNELFEQINDIKCVYCKEDNKFYKYNYDVMCIDLASEFSWTRLPTELILRFMAELFGITFHIFSDTTNYVHKIPETSTTNNIIYLGHIGEVHYIPLCETSKCPTKVTIPKYNTSKTMFYEWAIRMSKSRHHKKNANKPITTNIPKPETEQIVYVDVNKVLNTNKDGETQNYVQFGDS